MVPHVVRSQSLDRLNLRTVDTGAGTTIELRHISSEAPAADSGPQVRLPRRARLVNAAHQQRGHGSRPKRAAAAPAALAQLKAADGTGNYWPPPASPPPTPPPHLARCELSSSVRPPVRWLLAPPSGSGGAQRRNGYCLGSLADSVRSSQTFAGQRGQRRLSGPGWAGRGAGPPRRRAGLSTSTPRGRRERPG